MGSISVVLTAFGLEVTLSKLQKSYVWRGREDPEEVGVTTRVHNVMNNCYSSPDFALIGFCCDIGVTNNQGRPGAIDGPDAIRDALSNLAWQSQSSIEDVGNVVANTSMEDTQLTFSKQVSEQLSQNKFVIGLGGGHEIAYASYQGLSAALQEPNKRIGIINFDAHFDLRNPHPTPSSGTPFRQIAQNSQKVGSNFNYACIGVAKTANTQALFNYADAINVRYILDIDCEIEKIKTLLIPMLESIDSLYVTICLDAFSADIAPGVSAPSSLGICPKLVIKTLHWLANQQTAYNFQWRLADIAEMNPKYDIDRRTAKLAARIVSEIIEVTKHKSV